MQGTQATNSKRVFVLGALGSGKSTVLNILNGYGQAQQEQKFIASNQLTGCTQNFAYDFIPLPNGEQIQLIDSPGLADPNILIDMWVSLYNQQIAAQNWGIDLVVVIIEYAERPSTKEYQVFAVLNQALAAIKAENLVILFNKCPDQAEPEDARHYYETCCSQIKTDSKFPKLSDNNFLVLKRVGRIKRQMQGQELLNAQLEVNRILSKDVCDFVHQNLAKVRTKVQAKPADRKQLANSFMDAETRQEIQDQQKRFEEQRQMYEAQIQQQNQKMEQFQQLMAEKEQQQQIVLNEMKEQLRQQEITHNQNMRNLQDKSQAAMAEMQRQNEQQIAQIRYENQQKITQLENEIKNSKKGGGIFGKILGGLGTALGVVTGNPLLMASGATLLTR